MNCPFCKKPLTDVINSRPTKKNSQVWRRRRCLYCDQTFTTHEVIDLSHLIVIKKSGKKERFNRMKLYSGIFYSSQSSRIQAREVFIDKITREIEGELLLLQKKQLGSQEIAEIVLKILRKKNTPTFLRFLTYWKDITSDTQIRKELLKYLS